MAHRSIDDDDPGGFSGFERTSRVQGIADRVRLGREPAAAVGAVVASLALLAGAWWLLRPAPQPVESSIPSAAASATPSVTTASTIDGGASAASTTTELEVVVAQVSGAVEHPGVYQLAPGARVDDLVDAGGGYSADADPDRVNLAAPVHDGERIWVPRLGEEEVPSVVAGSGASAGPSGTSTGVDGGAEALVDVNTATAEQLEALPGVGPATAAAIVAHREANGPFASPEALLDVRGIGEAKLEQMRPMVTV